MAGWTAAAVTRGGARVRALGRANAVPPMGDATGMTATLLPVRSPHLGRKMPLGEVEGASWRELGSRLVRATADRWDHHQGALSVEAAAQQGEL